MWTAADEAAVSYVIRLPTAAQRREATSVLRSDFLAAISALAGCQRCGFVEQVLAAFNLELAASVRAAQGPDIVAGALLAAGPGPDVACDSGSGRLRSARDLAHQPGESSSSSSAVADTGNRFAEARTDIAGSGLMTPAQILSLVSDNHGGCSTLVGLLQFAWKGLDSASSVRGQEEGSGGDGDVSERGSGRHDGRLALGYSLLSRPRLLRRFLEESVMVMQDLNEDVGDCRRHSGYPGPTELASTLTRLETQRSHTLERLAAWGVLRAPPQRGPAMAESSTVALAPGGLRLAAGAEHPEPAMNPAAEWRAFKDHEDRTEYSVVESDNDDCDPRLGLGIPAGLRDPSLAVGATPPSPLTSPAALTSARLPPSSPAPAMSPLEGSSGRDVTVSGHGPGSRQRHHKQLAAAPAPQSPRRPQRTLPRPTAAAAGAGEGTSAGAHQGGLSPSTMSRHTAPGPEAVRSPPGSAGRSPAGFRSAGGLSEGDHRKSAVGGSAGAAVLGPGSSVEGLIQRTPTQPGDTSQPRDRGPTDQGWLPSPLRPLPVTPTRAAAAAVPEPSPEAPGGATTPRQEQTAPEEQQAPASAARGVPALPASPLSVAAAVAAAEGLADATVLVDAAAVAALSDGLRERVQHLVAQLVQVQQRRSRLEHACRHGVLAAGRKLLLILLQLLWASLRRAAAGTAAAPAAAVALSQGGAAAADEVDEGVAAAQPATDSEAEAASPKPPPPVQPPPPPPAAARSPAAAPRRRLPRYEGLLADLAAGLEEDDTHLEVATDLTASDLGIGIALEEQAEDLGGDPCLEGLSRASRSRRNGAGTGSGTSAVSGRFSHDTVALGLGHGASDGGEGLDGGGGGAGDAGWDAALVLSRVAGTGGGRGGNSSSSSRVAQGRASIPSSSLAIGAPLRRSGPLLPPSPSSSSAVGRQAVGWGATAPGWRPSEDVRGSTVRLASTSGGLEAAASGWRAAADPHLNDTGWLDGSGACQPGCIAAREQQQQAEQLRVLQGQLLRCQTSQTELQAEVGRLLDLLAEQRRVQEQATAALRRDLAQWQADPAALQGLGAEELGGLAARMEAALSRVRSAQLQAAAERDLVCPVCWERRKGLVFGCGHQTCCACGERLAACPICREPVSLRIRVYG